MSVSNKLMAEYGPERGMWAAVILQAFRDLKNRSDQNGEDPKSVRDNAWRWIHDAYTTASVPHPDTAGKQVMMVCKTTHERGFEWICDMLDLDMESIRTKSMTRAGVDEILEGGISTLLQAKRRAGRRKVQSEE